MIYKTQLLTEGSDYSVKHPDYTVRIKDWIRIRDCIAGESVIKSKEETYLPRPPGMSGIYADAYDDYLERAHFPLIASYALQGALGVIITKLPEFNVPYQLKYIVDQATKDGSSLQQLFLDCIIEVLQTGRCVLAVDVTEDHQFRFVKYPAESLINWKESTTKSKRSMTLAVLKEAMPSSSDILSHDTEDVYFVSYLDQAGNYAVKAFGDGGSIPELSITPKYTGKPIKQIPIFVAGSINNSLDQQPIPLLSVANCSIQIYRKEADLANSEYLSCNPTLCLVGASNDEALPNVVGSSVMIVLPDPAARVFYTVTDTAALDHVKNHIDSLYEEAIRHGVAILDARKGVEAAEALRIRLATQSASIYSVYLSVLNAIKAALNLMCDWGGFNKKEVIIDAPSALTYGIPDSAVIREVITGFGNGVIPISVVHRYLIGSGLLDQKVSLDEYIEEIEKYKAFREAMQLNMMKPGANGNEEDDGKEGDTGKKGEPAPKKGKQQKGTKPQAGDPTEKDNKVK